MEWEKGKVTIPPALVEMWYEEGRIDTKTFQEYFKCEIDDQIVLDRLKRE